MVFLAEYVTATDDVSVLPGLRRLALEAAGGQSAVGSWGHTLALPDGRLQGYGMMNSPGLPLTIGLVLARDAGLQDPEITRAIELSAKLLRRTLRQDDLWLRIRAASALAAIGKPAASALPELLDLIARAPASDDPRAMEQRFVSMAVFSTLLPRLQSLDDVDNDRLRVAIAQGLKNQDGRARGEISEIYRCLGYTQIRPLLPAIFEAVKTPAPSGEMFADGVRLNGLKVLASHHIAEGMQATADYLRTQNPWASEHRTPEILGVLDAYGAEAQAVVPHLEETAALFDKGEINLPKHLSRQKAGAVRETIKKIQAAEDRPELTSIQ